jgi:hypothetical protein
MMHFMMLTITKMADRHLLAEDVEGTDYEQGCNDAAVRILDVINDVMAGNDPMSVERMDVLDIFKLADRVATTVEKRPDA